MLTKLAENLTLFFILMPYIGLGFLPSDTQPLALIFSALLTLSLILEKRRIPAESLPILSVLLLALVAALLSLNKDFLTVARALAAHATPFFVFVFCYYFFKKNGSPRIVKVIDFSLFVVFIGFFLNVVGATGLIQLFVGRAIFESSLHARGFTSFFPEQSRVSEQLSFFFICYMVLGSLSVKRAGLLLLGAFISFSGQFFIIVIFLSLSFFSGIYLYSWSSRRVSRSEFLFLFIAPFAGFFLFMLLPNFLDFIVSLGMPARGATAVKNLLEQGAHGLSNDVGAIIKLTGFVLILAVLFEKPLNFEIASASSGSFWQDVLPSYAFIQNLIFGNQGVITAPYVYSSIGTWIVDFGVLGAVSAFVFISMSFKRVSLSNNYYVIVGFLFVLIMAFVKMPLANPTIWLVFALIVVYSKGGERVSGNSFFLR